MMIYKLLTNTFIKGQDTFKTLKEYEQNDNNIVFHVFKNKKTLSQKQLNQIKTKIRGEFNISGDIFVKINCKYQSYEKQYLENILKNQEFKTTCIYNEKFTILVSSLEFLMVHENDEDLTDI